MGMEDYIRGITPKTIIYYDKLIADARDSVRIVFHEWNEFRRAEFLEQVR